MKEKERKQVTSKDVLNMFESLADSTAKGFAHLSDKIGSVDKKVDSLDKKVGSLDKKVGSLDTKVNSLDTKVGSLDKKVNSLDTKVDLVIENLNAFREEVRVEFKRLWAEVDHINRRLDKIEKNNIEEIELLSGDVVELKSRVNRLEKKIAKMKLAN